MKTSRKELKLRARRALLGRYPAAVGIQVMMYVATIVFMIILEAFALTVGGIVAKNAGMDAAIPAMAAAMFFSILLLMVFFGMMIPGITRFYLNLCQGRKAKAEDMLWGIWCHGGKFFGIGILFSLLLGLLAAPVFVLVLAAAVTGEVSFLLIFFPAYYLILVIAGIYVSLTYNLFYFILADEPEKTIADALRQSRQMMKGNRGRIFMLSLSFLGWLAMSYITMGLGLLWLIPYMGCTYCCFYLDIKEKCGA